MGRTPDAPFAVGRPAVDGAGFRPRGKLVGAVGGRRRGALPGTVVGMAAHGITAGSRRSSARPCFLLTAGIWVVRGLLRRDVHIPLPPLLLPLLGFMGVVLLSLWQPADVWVGLLEWGKWGQIRADVSAGLRPAARCGRTAARAAGGGAAGGRRGLSGAYRPVAVWSQPMICRCILPSMRDFIAPMALFEQPNPYAGFLGLVGALLAGLALAVVWDWLTRITNHKSRITSHESRITNHQLPITNYQLPITNFKFGLLLFALAAVAAGLLASWSRGGWMGFAAALFVIAVMLPRRGGWGLVLAAVIVVGGLGLYAAGWLPASIASRLTGFLDYTRFEDVRGIGINDANYAVIERMAHWQAALSMWRERFWLGVGFGCYEAAYPAHRLINWPLALGHAHNYYLNLLAETGILGLGVYLALLGSIFVRLWRASRRTAGWVRGLALGLAGAWTHFAVHNFVDNILVNNVHLHLGVLLALSAWVIGQVGEPEKKTRSAEA